MRKASSFLIDQVPLLQKGEIKEIPGEFLIRNGGKLAHLLLK